MDKHSSLLKNSYIKDVKCVIALAPVVRIFVRIVNDEVFEHNVRTKAASPKLMGKVDASNILESSTTYLIKHSSLIIYPLEC